MGANTPISPQTLQDKRQVRGHRGGGDELLKLTQARPGPPTPSSGLSSNPGHTCYLGPFLPTAPAAFSNPLTWRGCCKVSSFFLPQEKRIGVKESLKRGHLGVRCPPPALGGYQPATPRVGASSTKCPATLEVGSGARLVAALPQRSKGSGFPPQRQSGLQVLQVQL